MALLFFVTCSIVFVVVVLCCNKKYMYVHCNSFVFFCDCLWW